MVALAEADEVEEIRRLESSVAKNTAKTASELSAGKKKLHEMQEAVGRLTTQCEKQSSEMQSLIFVIFRRRLLLTVLKGVSTRTILLHLCGVCSMRKKRQMSNCSSS